MNRLCRPAIAAALLACASVAGCQAETREIHSAVDRVKQSVDDLKQDIETHNQQLEEMLNER